MPKREGHHEGYALVRDHDTTFKRGKTKRTTGCSIRVKGETRSLFCDACPFPTCRLGVSATVFAGYVEEFHQKEANAKKMPTLSGH